MLRVRLTRDQLAAIVYSCELHQAALKRPVKTREQERREQLIDRFLELVWDTVESATDTQEMPGQPLS